MSTEKIIASYLLQIKAIKLEPAKPFTWASGWKSPIYCDNRKTLAYPEIRSFIRDSFVELIKKEFPAAEIIAGVATGAIAQGALVADKLGLPFIYIRSTPKSHGLENLIEGHLEPGKNVVIIEDLISTGGSSIKAVEAVRNADAKVLGLAAIFTYGFKIADNNFKQNNCKFFTLSNYNVLIDEAIKLNYINENDRNILNQWRLNPDKWNV
jgi:orotate phosphoribosyltransferase